MSDSTGSSRSAELLRRAHGGRPPPHSCRAAPPGRSPLTEPARRHQRLELASDLRQRVAHADDDLAAQLRPHAVGRLGRPRSTAWRSRSVRRRRLRRCRRCRSRGRGRATASTIASRTSRARYFDRDPMVTSCPTEASRAARAMPAGPVAPRSPMCMAPRLRCGRRFRRVERGRACGTARRQEDPDHRRADRRVAGVRRRQAGPGAGCRDRADRGRSGPSAHPTHRPQAPHRTRGPRVRRHRAGPCRRPARHARGASGGASTAPSTRSDSPPRPASATTSWGPRWDDVKVAVEISAYSLKMLADATTPLMTEGGSLVGLTSTPRSPGRPTTGWASPRRRSSRPTATSPENSARGASAATSSRPARSAPWPPSRSPASPKFEDVWDDKAPLGWDVDDSTTVAETTVALLSDWFRGHDRLDDPRRRRLSLRRRLTFS